MNPPSPTASRCRPFRRVVAFAGAGLLIACGAGEPASTQAAARVNKDEITVHQIGAMLAQQATAAEPATPSERQVLERLIDRQLAVQKAGELKLDREPKVVQAVEAARQEIIARAYTDHLGESVARPSEAEIRKYFEDHPALFSERKIYQLQEFVIDAGAAEVGALKAALPSMNGADELTTHLQSNNLRFATSRTVRAAEQVPLSLLASLSRLQEGQAVVQPRANGIAVLVVTGSQPQPVDQASAAKAIEQFLLHEQRQKRVADEMKGLRAAAQIEYLGRFATPAAPADEGSRTAAAVASAGAASVTPIDSNTVNRGLGLK